MKEALDSNFFERSILYYTRRSFYFHIGMIILIVLSSYIFGKNSQWTTKVTIVESAVRVDVVAMPKYTIQELKAFQEQNSDFDLEHGIDEELAKIDDPEELAFKIKKKKQDFAAMLKNIGNKKVSKNKQKKKKKKNPLSFKMRNQLKDLVLQGNKLSKGTALTGEGVAGELGVFEQYISGIPAWVRPNWKLPSYLMEKDFKCRVQIFLKPSGKLIKAKIYETSGNNEYDTRALNAVRSSDPFPELTKEIGARAARGEIVLGFPL